MLVMDMVVTVTMVMPGIIVVMMMPVTMRMSGDGDFAHRCGLQRPDEAAALGPDQPRAKRRDQAVACDLDRPLGTAHGLGGDVEEEGADPDDRNRHQSLQQRRCKRQRDA